MANILVVEDDLVTRKLVIGVLENDGHTVDCREDGLEGLYALKHDGPYDLVVTDIRMPYIDGRTLVKSIRATKSIMDIPVLLMSGVVGPKSIAELCEDGVTAFLAKPIQGAELLEYVARYVNSENRS